MENFEWKFQIKSTVLFIWAGLWDLFILVVNLSNKFDTHGNYKHINFEDFCP